MTTDKVTTTPAPPPPEPTCPECGAVVRDRLARRCWMCHEPLDASGAGGGPNPFRLPEPRGDNPGWAVVGVLTLLLFAGLAIEAPGILVGLAVLAVPVLIRAAVVSGRSKAAGQPITPESVTLAFLTSFGIAAVVGVAAAAAFFVTCFAVCMGGAAISTSRFGPGEPWIWASIILGGLVGLVVFILLIRALSRRKG